MDGFAVKIGELHLRSDRPITEEQHKRAKEYIKRHGPLYLKFNEDDLEVVMRVER